MTTPETRKKRKLTTTIAVALILIVFVFVAVSRLGFDKALVKQKLDEYIAQVHERGLAQGNDIDITYGDLEVTGGFIDRHVVIHDVKATVKSAKPEPLKPGEVAKPNSLTATTPEIALYPTAMDLSSMRISFTQPINFTPSDAPDKSLLKISSDVPLDFAIAQKTQDNVPYIKIDHNAPGAIDLTFLKEEQASGKEDATPNVTPVYDTLHIAFTAGSRFHINLATDGSHLGTADVDFKPITITPQSTPNAVVNVAAIQIKLSDTLNAKKITKMSATSTIGPVTGPVDVLPASPVAMMLDVAYSGPSPAAAKTDDDAAAAKAEPMTINLKKLSITTKDASINADADFSTAPGDLLPVGKGDINIVNMQYFRQQFEKNNTLNAQNEGWFAPVIQQITGTPLDQLKDVNIPISREPKGSFKMGNSTFEEIVAVALKAMMQQKIGGVSPAGAPVMPLDTVPTPNLPAADKPKSAPIAVPDNGVRG